MFKIIELFDKDHKRIAQGIEFEKTKRVVLQWDGEINSIVHHDSLDSLRKLSEKDGRYIKITTEIIKEIKVPCKDCKIDRGKYIHKEDIISFMMNEHVIPDGYMKFYGDDNCEPNCNGWDGDSHRCSCGARRVMWQGINNPDEDFLKYDCETLLDKTIYKKLRAEAY